MALINANEPLLICEAAMLPEFGCGGPGHPSARSLLNTGDKNELIKSSNERVSLPEMEGGSKKNSLHF